MKRGRGRPVRFAVEKLKVMESMLYPTPLASMKQTIWKRKKGGSIPKAMKFRLHAMGAKSVLVLRVT